jgi:hypothetical protein
MSNNLPELWDIDRACAYLGCSKYLVYRLTRERRIRFVRVEKSSASGPIMWPPGWKLKPWQLEMPSPSPLVSGVVGVAIGIGLHGSSTGAPRRAAQGLAQRQGHLRDELV